jgi:hypothetical protein
MTKPKDFKKLLDKVELMTKEKKIDLSSGEDLSVGIMNLISIEEHLFFTAQKTNDPKYLDLLNEVRLMRTELLRKIIKDYEGEVWCISKHLLSASMRLMEVGTKELKKGNRKEANEMFEKSFKLYSLFWGINLKAVELKDIPQMEDNINLIDDKTKKVTKASVFDKLNSLLQKALDCCRE